MQAALAARLAAVPRSAPPKPPDSRASAAEWLTVEDVVRRLKKSPTTVRRILKRGHFPGARKMGGEWRIPEKAVRAYEASCPSA
jgi:excisionase family DNA binding protein